MAKIKKRPDCSKLFINFVTGLSVYIINFKYQRVSILIINVKQ